LILFGWSRNIYEGVTSATITPIYNSDKKTSTFASTDLITAKQNVDNSKIDNNSYFMKVYYYLPKASEYKGSKLPISHIYHNLPNDYTVSFTNLVSEKFGPSSDSDNIFIQGPKTTISKCYREYVNQKTGPGVPSPYTFKNLVDDINANKVNIGKSSVKPISKPIKKNEHVVKIPKNSDDKKGTKIPANPPSSLPSASITYAKISDNNGIKFNGTYDANAGTNLISGESSKVIPSEVAGKSINLVTFYLNF
jgi:hypothetical protein